MGFCWTTLTIGNMDRSIEFYRDTVGLELQRRYFPVPAVEVAFLGTKDTPTLVELISFESEPEPKHSSSVSLGFSVESLEDTIAHLKHRGITDFDGPVEPAPGIRFIHITDPDGVRVQFVQN